MNQESKLHYPIIIFAFCLLSQNVKATPVQAIDFPRLASQCAPGVHIDTLSAIVRHESKANPWAIGLNSKEFRLPRQPLNRGEAVAAAEWLKANGYNFDGGFGQVNVRNLDILGMTVADLFDPCKNLAGAAKVLTDCYSRATKKFGAGQPALQAALSCYNTGNFTRGFSNGYVALVAQNAVLDVPALAPIPVSAPQPVKLQSGAANGPVIVPVNNIETPDKKPTTDGIFDAFGERQSDAFSSSSEQQRKEKDEKRENN